MLVSLADSKNSSIVGVESNSYSSLLKHPAYWIISLTILFKELCTNASFMPWFTNPWPWNNLGQRKIHVGLDMGNGLGVACTHWWQKQWVSEVLGACDYREYQHQEIYNFKYSHSITLTTPFQEGSFMLCVQEFCLVEISIEHLPKKKFGSTMKQELCWVLGKSDWKRHGTCIPKVRFTI